ncbi:Uma2 family endonuclease [Roseofilum sp. Guam]|uniref:Uma2 family endonuclease n=1 Tax=Roseofilum sp. Guam TaxID=2821502 RepID=UPI00298D8BE8|nr:Uma2 family endonuclease [Roseofilum sp. Guam]
MVQLYPNPKQKSLPTMYDLPSEDPEEPGLPDEFHDYQPDLLTQTCQSPRYREDDYFIASDLNLYYDSEHTLWHKRPDWFVVLGAKRSRTQQELRLSYVIWQEQISPFLVVELASPGTEDEDLGRTERKEKKPPTKWEVYEKILQVPYYVTYDLYQNQFRGFVLKGEKYEPLELSQKKVWLEALGLGLGLWQGVYEGVEGRWLRFYNQTGEWIPTPSERAEQAESECNLQQQRADQAELELQQLRDKLRQLSIDPDSLS